MSKTITAVEFRDALISRVISSNDFARQIGKTNSTIRGWCKNGVPKKHEHSVREMLKKTEIARYGGEHMDIFPDTIKDKL